MIALLVAAWAGPQERAAIWTQDYATQVAAAQDAEDHADPQAAITWWEAADALSGGNRDTATALVGAYLAVGRQRDAGRTARRATESHPNAAWSHLLLAQAHAGTDGPIAWSARAARHLVRAADRVAPDPTTAAAVAANDAAMAAPEPAGDAWRLSAGFSASAVAWSGSKAAPAWSTTVRAIYNDRLWMAGTLRRVTTADGAWTAGWARMGGDVGGLGGELIVGVTQLGDQRGPTVFAGRAWATRGRLAVIGGFAHSGYVDGDVDQGEGHLQWVASPNLALTTGLRVTTHSGDVAVASETSATWSRGDWSVTGVARLGREIRPVRLSDAVLYDVASPLDGSAALTVTRALRPDLRMSAGVEAMHTDDGWGAVPTVGLTFTPGAQR